MAGVLGRRPDDRDLAAGDGKRSVLRGVGREFVHHQGERYRRPRVDLAFGAFDVERRALAAAEGAERLLDDLAHTRSFPSGPGQQRMRSEEHTSELQSLMRISYAVFCLKKKKYKRKHNTQI